MKSIHHKLSIAFDRKSSLCQIPLINNYF